jgi:hypothetical protein
VLREFGFGPGHIGEEQAPNILQTLLYKLFDLLESSIESAAISREEFFTDAVEFLPSGVQQAVALGRSWPYPAFAFVPV